MKPALSQVSSLPSPFAKDVEDYAAGGCQAIEIWMTKLETYLEQHPATMLPTLRERFQVEFPVASYQGGILASQGDARRVAWDLFERRLQLCAELAIGTLVVACDVAAPVTQQDVERVQWSLGLAAKSAAAAQVRIALEFQASSAFGNNLQTAASLVAHTASPWLGICLDVFHYQVGSSKPDDLGYLTKENLFHVQVCDLADVPREFAADRDRILPGDGDIPLQPIVSRLAEIGYDGHLAVEVMNPLLWQVPARHFGEIAWASLARLLRQGSAHP